MPEESSKSFSGELSFSPEGLSELFLDGSFRDPPYTIPSDFSAPIINGVSQDGRRCTLFDTFESFNDTDKSKFVYNKLIIGSNFVDLNLTTFESAVFELTSFQGWLHRSGIKVKTQFGKLPKTYTPIEYKRPKDVSIRLNSLESHFLFESYPSQTHEYNKFGLTQKDIIRIKPKTKKKLDWYLDKIFKFRIFISLLANKPVDLVSIRVYYKKRSNHEGKLKYIRKSFDVCFHVLTPKKQDNFMRLFV